MKTSTKKMRGFMCHSPAATAVCLTSDPRSVISPRRPDRTIAVDHSRLLKQNAAKYSRLVEPHMLSAGYTKSMSMSIRKQKDQLTVKTHPKPLQTTPAENVFQVVVMRVSIHCQGCAGKVRKHLSKMEGVTSFNIDLETKRVTVMGNVSPVRVLESVSKVKKAEFWSC